MRRVLESIRRSLGIGPQVPNPHEDVLEELRRKGLDAESLERLLEMGNKAVPILLEVLSSDPSTTGARYAPLNIYETQWHATEGLAKLKAPESVEPLMELLEKSDGSTQSRIIWTLGEIGDKRAVPAIIPYLGNRGTYHMHWRAAEEALKNLGEYELATMFSRALLHNRFAVKFLKKRNNRAVVAGLIRALDSDEERDLRNAAWALGELGAVEALPRLRRAARRARSLDEIAQKRIEEAISKLESVDNLPRPADAETAPLETLPRISSASDDTQSLPREAEPPRPLDHP